MEELRIVRQDLVKQRVLREMYNVGSEFIFNMEKKGLKRYPYGQSVFYSISEFEGMIKDHRKELEREQGIYS